MAPPKINIKDRFNDGEIDLSMSDLQDIPVKEIGLFKKAFSLDLSNNHLTLLPNNFPTLSHLTKLDLSKNSLKELPENFGDLIKLKYLDLYQNQLNHLPLSFSKLQSLKWLDLKDNPLVPAVGKVAGPCLDSKQCQDCAKNIIYFFKRLQEKVDEDLIIRRKHEKQNVITNQQKEKKKSKEKHKKVDNEINEESEIKLFATKKIEEEKKCNDNQMKKKSFFKMNFVLLALIIFILFILASIKFNYTNISEVSVTQLYHNFVNSLPSNLQDYGRKLNFL